MALVMNTCHREAALDAEQDAQLLDNLQSLTVVGFDPLATKHHRLYTNVNNTFTALTRGLIIAMDRLDPPVQQKEKLIPVRPSGSLTEPGRCIAQFGHLGERWQKYVMISYYGGIMAYTYIYTL